MKQSLLLALVILLAQIGFTQTQVTRDAHGNKVSVGFISKQELASDTAFTWFAQNQQGYTPNQDALQLLKANRDSVNIIAFG